MFFLNPNWPIRWFFMSLTQVLWAGRPSGYPQPKAQASAPRCSVYHDVLLRRHANQARKTCRSLQVPFYCILIKYIYIHICVKLIKHGKKLKQSNHDTQAFDSYSISIRFPKIASIKSPAGYVLSPVRSSYCSPLHNLSQDSGISRVGLTIQDCPW